MHRITCYPWYRLLYIDSELMLYNHPQQKKSKKTTETLTFKRPEGMHREVYALLYSDKK